MKQAGERGAYVPRSPACDLLLFHSAVAVVVNSSLLLDRQLYFLIGVPINELVISENLIEVIKPHSSRQSLTAWLSHTQAPFATLCLIF